MSSTKVIEQDIQYLIEFNNKILLEVAALTTALLNEKQELLRQCKWSDGESNTDTDFSELACRCVEQVWLQIKTSIRHQTQLVLVCSITYILKFI